MNARARGLTREICIKTALQVSVKTLVCASYLRVWCVTRC